MNKVNQFNSFDISKWFCAVTFVVCFDSVVAVIFGKLLQQVCKLKKMTFTLRSRTIWNLFGEYVNIDRTVAREYNSLQQAYTKID